MKTKTIIQEISHDDLVDFFSTTLFSSSMFACDYSREEYKSCCKVDDNDCIEDKMAKLVLAGKAIQIGDMYAEDADEYNDSKLPHKWDKDNQIMWYDVTLEDIKRGIQKCLDGHGDEREDVYLRRCAMDLINGDGDLDLPEAEAIMQVVLWGVTIYG